MSNLITWKYELNGAELRFHVAPPFIEELDLRPWLDEAVRLLGLAKGRYIKPDIYDILFILEIRGREGPLVGCSYFPGGDRRVSDAWERTRHKWPPEIRELVPGPYIGVSVSQLLERRAQLGEDGMLVDLADTLHHELIHLNTGVLHEDGVDDLCLRDSERFLKEVVELHPLDTRVVRRLLRAAAIRRQTGLG